jgi:hypothetical protein
MAETGFLATHRKLCADSSLRTIAKQPSCLILGVIGICGG